MTVTSSLLINNASTGITTISLNRPEKNNAFDSELIKNLTTTLKKINKDNSIRVVILKAAGNNFCAGADIKWMQSSKNYSKAKNISDAKQLANMFKILQQLNKPTVACIQGAVAGGGLGLIACCDIAIAASDANFCFREVRLGIVPASISPYVIAAIGTRAASRYFLTAERFDAREAHRIGLVHEVVENAKLSEAAETLAQQLLKNGPEAVAAAKKLIARCGSINNKLIEETIKLIAQVRTSEEGQEGLAAFLEKRSPSWTK